MVGRWIGIYTRAVHGHTEDSARLADRILAYAEDRFRLGWDAAQYDDWSERLRNANFAFVSPSTHAGETITRFAIVNPRTTGGRHRHDPRHYGLT